MSEPRIVYIGLDPGADPGQVVTPLADEELVAWARIQAGPGFCPYLVDGRVHVSPHIYAERVPGAAGKFRLVRIEKGPR